MTLAYAPVGGAKKEVVISFDPPLLGYEEVKPRLLAMKAEAQEGLGMVRSVSAASVFNLFLTLDGR